MKKLAILLVLCLVLTMLGACKSEPSITVDGEIPTPSAGDEDKTDNKDENKGDTDTDTSNPELEFDDIPVPVVKGIEGSVTESSINIRESAGTKGKKIETAEKGKNLLVSKLQGVDSVLWGYMGEGWVCLDYVSFDMDRNGTIIYCTVTANNLSAREAPHTFCEVVEKLPKGTRLEISAFACFGTAIWGLTPSGWICLNYVELEQGVEVVEGQNAEKLPPFYLAPDYKEVTPKEGDSIAPSMESVTGTWEFVKLTSFYSTIYEEYFTAVQGYLTLNEDGTFVCGYDDYVSTLYSNETSVSSWDISEEGNAELGGTYEVAENGIVLSYTYYKDTAGDEVITQMSRTVTLQATQTGDMLFVKNLSDIVYTPEKSYEKITHPVLYRNVSGSLLEKVYPGTYY